MVYALVIVIILVLMAVAALLFRSSRRSSQPTPQEQLRKDSQDHPKQVPSQAIEGLPGYHPGILREDDVPLQEYPFGEEATTLLNRYDEIKPEASPPSPSHAEFIPTLPTEAVMQDAAALAPEQLASDREEVDAGLICDTTDRIPDGHDALETSSQPEVPSDSQYEVRGDENDGGDTRDMPGREVDVSGESTIRTSPEEEPVPSAAPMGLQQRPMVEVGASSVRSILEPEAAGTEAIATSPPLVNDLAPPVDTSDVQLPLPEEGETEEDDGHRALQIEIPSDERPTQSTSAERESVVPAVPLGFQPHASSKCETVDSTLGVPKPEVVSVDEPTASLNDFPGIDRRESITKRSTKRPRTPREYRPPVRAPSSPREGSQSPQTNRSLDRSLPIEVRLLFQRGGSVQVTLLARRLPGSPEEIPVSGSGGALSLTALQENYYQDITPANIAALLRQGVEWEGCSPDGCQTRWSLSGREIYVLSAHPDLNGFVSTPRLVLGRDHVVLCVAARLGEVQNVVEQTGSPTPEILDSTVGIPVGWVSLRGVLPGKPIPQSAEQDILNVLRPLPDLEIAFEGGIRLEYNTWLTGYPPSIHVYGDAHALDEVMIDGKSATRGRDGTYTINGWDLPGSHSVWCTSSSRTYSIRDGAEQWDTWNAYSWTVYDPNRRQRVSLPAICGAKVIHRSPVSEDALEDLYTVILPASNSVVIGKRPGEIFRSKVRTDIHSDYCAEFVPFEPVWALPTEPYHANKEIARVILIGEAQHVQRSRADRQTKPDERTRIIEWYSTILAAGRKGLRTEPDSSEITALWQGYKRQAKTLWKKQK